jgi:GGDEF domain-containing protein
MRTAASLIRALGQRHTYSLRRNPTLALGLAWGCLAGLFSVSFAACAAGVGPGRAPSSIILVLGLSLFLAHPVLIGLLSGAFGTVLRDHDSTLGSSGKNRPQSGAIADPATGLYSPDYMLDQLRHALARVARSRQTVTVVIFELEEETDDPGLRLLAETIRPLVREGDILGRLGAGQLLLIVHGDIPCAFCLSSRVSESLYERSHLRLLAGVARWPDDGKISAELLYAADLVLKASWQGRHSPDCPGTTVSLQTSALVHP